MNKNIFIKIVIITMLIFGIFQISNVNAVTANNNPLLREILVNGEAIKPEFDQFITDYVMAVNNSIDKIKIEAIADDPNAKVEVLGDTNLKEGKNDFEIKVTAEDGVTIQSYFLHITRGNVNKANANLKSIQIDGMKLNPEFNTKDTKYLVEYNGYIEKLNIKAVAEADKAKVEIINNENFNSVIHEITIRVTAEDGITTKEYLITAKKANEDVENPDGLVEYKETIQKQGDTKVEDKKEKSYNILFGILVLIILTIAIIFVLKRKKR